MKLEMYLKTHLTRPILTRNYKSYNNALNHIKSVFVSGKIAKNCLYIIRDEIQHIVCNAHYEPNGNYLYICETDNIGLNHKETIINR